MKQRNSCRACFLSGLLVVATLVMGAPALSADDVTLQNDSIRDMANAAIQVGFVAEERAAAWLTAICDGNLTAVQVLWLSLTGGSTDLLGDSITVSDPGTFPTPGTQRVKLDGPVLQDGFFNQYPLPQAIPMTTGQEIVVDFKFLDSPFNVGPSVVTDTVGCQTGKNGIFAKGDGVVIPDMWWDACILGVSGDIAIRAVIDCPLPPVFLDNFDYGSTSDWDRTQSPVP